MTQTTEICPMRLRFIASLVGGTLGAVNPMLEHIGFGIGNPYNGRTVSGVSLPQLGFGGYLAVMLIVPCLLANFICYPWLYREIRARLRSNGTPGIFRISVTFGFMATAAAIVFSAAEMTMLAALEHAKEMPWFGYFGLFGSSLFSFGVMAIFYIPIMLIAGYLYTLANTHLITRYYHPNIADTP